ncbi:permease prefix domain 1-containing protein [Ruania halotolerans]|uniref:permease prefix domain 1-containing protein n=1 Tax=Ruania halotolerans TaxID=2897773 RepID=UPI001E57804F|nr:permease prefix domain 1-containing protein [Ruania halotolerans]UFU08267.1 permease prefix domain 1-containing protein [Ruania halotolerans]
MESRHPENTLNTHIDIWRGHLLRRQAIAADDVDEMEDHLRSQVNDLVQAGLTEDEAFLIAVKRIGNLDAVSAEFAREHSERLWKQLVLAPDADGGAGWLPRELVVAMVLGAGAGLTTVAGVALIDDPSVIARNVGLFTAPFLIAYLAWKRRLGVLTIALIAGVFAVLALVLNLYPFEPGGDTVILAALHTPVVLWSLVGIAYIGGKWGSHSRRMDLVRFTGEWAIYLSLLALGGGVLIGLTFAVLSLVGADLEPVLESWILPLAVPGAVLIAAWLVEAKQDVVENIAPVLTRVFTPLTLVLVMVTLAVLLAAGDLAEVDRELLILMDAILVLVLALLLYSLSARDPLARPGFFDALLLALVGAAVVVDLVALVAMFTRIADFGLSANKVVALGLNLLLLVHLSGAAWFALGILRRRRPFAAQAAWQTRYLPLYGMWAAAVIAATGPVFSFA